MCSQVFLQVVGQGVCLFFMQMDIVARFRSLVLGFFWCLSLVSLL